MSESEACSLIRRWFEEGWNGQNSDLIDEIFAPGFTAEGGPHGTLDRLSYKQYHQDVTTASPDLVCEIVNLYESEGFVVTHIHASGTHSGCVGDLEASGEMVTTEIIDVWKIIDGKIVERRNAEFDSLGIGKQVGNRIRFDP